MANPSTEHWTALKRVLRYLQGTKELGISYNSGHINQAVGQPNSLNIEAWSDSSWGEDPDDARSTNGHVVFMAGVLISWKSSKQQSVALSSTEAEYVSQALTGTQVMWTRGILTEMGIEQAIPSGPTTIYADNQGAIKLATNPVFQKRTKHIAVKFHYTRDLIKQGDVELSYKPTDQMIADGLTKPLGPILFKKFVTSLGMTTVTEASTPGAASSPGASTLASSPPGASSPGAASSPTEKSSLGSKNSPRAANSPGAASPPGASSLGPATPGATTLGQSIRRGGYGGHAATGGHSRGHDERRIGAHRGRMATSERRIGARGHHAITGEQPTDGHSGGHF
jgi:hypothetical protein